MSTETLPPPAPTPVNPPKPVIETRRFAAMNPPDLPRRADTGNYIDKRDAYDGPVLCHLNAVTMDGVLENHPCTAGVHALILEKRPDFNKKSDYLLRFRDGVVVSLEPAQRAGTLAGFAIDDPDSKAKANTWIFNVYDGGHVSINNQPERVIPATTDLVTQEIVKQATANTLRVGQTILDRYVVKEIHLLPGYQQVFLDNGSRTL